MPIKNQKLKKLERYLFMHTFFKELLNYLNFRFATKNWFLKKLQKAEPYFIFFVAARS